MGCVNSVQERRGISAHRDSSFHAESFLGSALHRTLVVLERDDAIKDTDRAIRIIQSTGIERLVAIGAAALGFSAPGRGFCDKLRGVGAGLIYATSGLRVDSFEEYIRHLFETYDVDKVGLSIPQLELCLAMNDSILLASDIPNLSAQSFLTQDSGRLGYDAFRSLICDVLATGVFLRVPVRSSTVEQLALFLKSMVNPRAIAVSLLSALAGLGIPLAVVPYLCIPPFEALLRMSESSHNVVVPGGVDEPSDSGAGVTDITAVASSIRARKEASKVDNLVRQVAEVIFATFNTERVRSLASCCDEARVKKSLDESLKVSTGSIFSALSSIFSSARSRYGSHDQSISSYSSSRPQSGSTVSEFDISARSDLATMPAAALHEDLPSAFSSRHLRPASAGLAPLSVRFADSLYQSSHSADAAVSQRASARMSATLVDGIELSVLGHTVAQTEEIMVVEDLTVTPVKPGRPVVATEVETETDHVGSDLAGDETHFTLSAQRSVSTLEIVNVPTLSGRRKFSFSNSKSFLEYEEEQMRWSEEAIRLSAKLKSSDVPFQSRHIAALCALYILEQGSLEVLPAMDLLQYVEVRHLASLQMRV